MRVAITIQHPAHVHFYRPVRGDLERAGHEVAVFVRDKDVAAALLAEYDVPHTVLARVGDAGPVGLARTQVRYEARLWRALRRFDPDVVTGIGGLAAAHVAPLVGAASVVFTDSEGVAGNALVAPFADVVCTPTWYDGDFGDAHRRYAGFQELAYLHPDRFDPAPDRLRAAGVDPDERYYLLRFAGWDAHHDVGEHGLTTAAKAELVRTLDRRGTVYVSAEGPLPDRLEPYRLPVSPGRIHDLLRCADLYAGDSATMATEAALLGTPAVRSDSHAAGHDLSNFAELDRYGLVVSTGDEDRAIRHARELASWPDASAEWRRRRDRLVADTVDVAAFAVDVLEEEGEGEGADARTGAADALATVRRLARIARTR